MASAPPKMIAASRHWRARRRFSPVFCPGRLYRKKRHLELVHTMSHGPPYSDAHCFQRTMAAHQLCIACTCQRRR
eukprot:1265617-Karenia_brevis.AAC.1